MFTEPAQRISESASQASPKRVIGSVGPGPQLRVSCGAARLTTRVPQRAACHGPDGEYHLPFHAVNHSGLS